MEDLMIKVEHVSKEYKLYDKKSDRLREAVSPTHKKYYKLFHALHNISFEVKKGETIGIIGTNGSGKSTLLKILSGVIAPSSGTFTLNGKVSALLELGAGFNGEYTGIQNIELNGTMMGYSREEIERRKEEIIRFADIGDYINQPVKNYSSGMFARLAFAVAISIEPEILIVDEALSVGDVFFQNKCFRKFEKLREKGTSILFVSHDIPTVRNMCSYVLWIDQGKQVMFGESNDVCNYYFNAQTKRINEEQQKSLKCAEAAEIISAEHMNEKITVPRISPNCESMLSDRVEILSVFVRDERQNITNRIMADAEYTICIVTKFNEEFKNIIVGFVMENNKGICCVGENTYAKSLKGLAVKKGDIIETTFTFTAPRLKSGQYEISPAVAMGTQENHVNLTWLRGVLSVLLEREGYEFSEIGVEMEVNNRELEEVSFFD